jgi:hypothetical protein
MAGGGRGRGTWARAAGPAGGADGSTGPYGAGQLVGAENFVTSCDVQIFVYEATELVSSQRPDGRRGERGSVAGGGC